MSSFTENAH